VTLAFQKVLTKLPDGAVHKGIFSQDIDRVRSVDVNRNPIGDFGNPFICLSFANDSVAGEVIRAISEVFCHEVHAFVGPHTNYDVNQKDG
jgi:hypothetical protein